VRALFLAYRQLPSHCVLTWAFLDVSTQVCVSVYTGALHIMGLHLTTSPVLNHLPKASLQILSPWGLELQQINVMACSVHNKGIDAPRPSQWKLGSISIYMQRDKDQNMSTCIYIVITHLLFLNLYIKNHVSTSIPPIPVKKRFILLSFFLNVCNSLL
jgi:hypothetical protein